MAKEYSKKFYKSGVWSRARDICIKRAGGLCEICYRAGIIEPGKIVHHKEHLNPDNINNPEVTLNVDNLEYVCKKCHNLLHEHDEISAGKNAKSKNKNNRQPRRYTIGDNGAVLMPPC